MHPELISSEFSEKLQASSGLEPDELGVCKTGFPEVLSYQTLHTKDSTDLECTRKLQAFKKASSLMGLGIQALEWNNLVYIL